MRKTITAFVAATLLATIPLTASTQNAAAWHKGWKHGVGAGIGAGVGLGIGLGIAGALTRPREREVVVIEERPRYRERGYSEAHYAWCEGKYNSYEASSNTFVTYSGRVQQCRSPY